MQIAVPRRTYHVQASGVASLTRSSRPASRRRPASAPVCVGACGQTAEQERAEHRPVYDRRNRQARREHRSPAAREHRDADRARRPSRGQPAREPQQRRGGPASAAPAARRSRSTVVEASELSDALRFDIAAAKIAAITSPEIPCGRLRTMKAGKISSLVDDRRQRVEAVEGVQHQADAAGTARTARRRRRRSGSAPSGCRARSGRSAGAARAADRCRATPSSGTCRR